MFLLVREKMETEQPKRHLHRCQNCGVIWGHGNMLFRDVEAHKCPKCGKSEWLHYSGLKPDQPAKTAAVQRTYYVIDLVALLQVGILVLAGIFVGQVIADWLLARE